MLRGRYKRALSYSCSKQGATPLSDFEWVGVMSESNVIRSVVSCIHCTLVFILLWRFPTPFSLSGALILFGFIFHKADRCAIHCKGFAMRIWVALSAILYVICKCWLGC